MKPEIFEGEIRAELRNWKDCEYESQVVALKSKLSEAESKLAECAAALAKKDAALREIEKDSQKQGCNHSGCDAGFANPSPWHSSQCPMHYLHISSPALSITPCPEVLEAVRREWLGEIRRSVEALAHWTQADEDGIMVSVSRQAVEDIVTWFAKHDKPAIPGDEKQTEKKP